MYGSFIQFAYPWLLLTIIPAAALTLIPYFRLNKKYRKTRNRIVSMVLHGIILTLAVLTLSGMTVVSRVPNGSNQIVILVDMSESENLSAEKRDDFVETVVTQAKFDGFGIAIVTFGYDQETAVPFTHDMTALLNEYKHVELPDVSATDIASALSYAQKLFSDEGSGKIVLVTDGKETDGNALSVIREIAAKGIKTDIAYVPSEYSDFDVQVTGMVLPDTHVDVGDVIKIGVKIRSEEDFSADIEFSDNGEISLNSQKNVEIAKGEQIVYIEHSFAEQGLHELHCNVSLAGGNEKIVQNNDYYVYHYLRVFDKLLVLESEAGGSQALEDILTEDGKFDVTVKNVLDEDIPTTIEELREYDQIILNNVSYADLAVHEDLEAVIMEYVRDYGGGLFTVGGNDTEGSAHAYNRADMLYSTYLRQMLPVEVIKYTPPVAVLIIIDRSGSMGQDKEGESFWYAKAGAVSCVNALTERDYIGVVTLGDYYRLELPLTPRTQETKIYSTIDRITTNAGEGTVFPGAIERAGMALRELKNVDKRHIIIVTDGGVPDDQRAVYEEEIKNLYDNFGITFSTVLIGETATSEAGQNMKYATELGHGRFYATFDNKELIRLMREDLNVPEIEEVTYEPFYPVITDVLSPIVKNVEKEDREGAKNSLTVQLQGFYGVKERRAATTVLTGPYGVPIYSYWKFGKGSVGSFMCDLSGDWSGGFVDDDNNVVAGFIEDANGRTFIVNAINSLMPLESVREDAFEIRLNQENYSNHVSIFTPLEEGEYYGGTITDCNGETVAQLNEAVSGDVDKKETAVYVTAPLSAENAYSRVDFVVRKGGVYTITVNKYSADGNVLATVETFKEFSYSKEYDVYAEYDDAALVEQMKTLAAYGKGSVIADLEEPNEIFDSFSIVVDKVFDPRLTFMIIILVLFLLDIAVRKFKFKWPHELIKEAKAKKEMKR